ncbi:lysostaphin resistance A-like protein [Larkinella harenae]
MSLGAVLTTVIIRSAGLVTDAADTVNFIQQVSRHPYGWYLLIAVQGVSHLCSYLIPALLCWYGVAHARWRDFHVRPLRNVAFLWAGLLAMVTWIPVNDQLLVWNERIELPGLLRPVEEWMRQKEYANGLLTHQLTSFTATHQLLLALLVIGVIASLGEEVYFRGVLQTKLIAWTGNSHAGIWLAAALFSAVHFQFYGFVPRLLLGALMGYLYCWSGNLWVAVLAHFINNGLAVLMTYLNVPALVTNGFWRTVLLLISVLLLTLFYRRNQKINTSKRFPEPA